jgi:hypothetical protein
MKNFGSFINLGGRAIMLNLYTRKWKQIEGEDAKKKCEMFSEVLKKMQNKYILTRPTIFSCGFVMHSRIRSLQRYDIAKR